MPNAPTLHVHLLDMGSTMYGDCLLLQGGGKTILIDGGHPGDWKGKGDAESIPDQLAGLLGKKPPFKVSLLVVTHCHSDHIGCLPKLVADGTLQAEWALVADEHLGFGRSRRDDDFADWQGQPARVRQVAAGLREENHAHLPDDALAQFLADAATLEEKYRAMLAGLERARTKVIRYLGENTKGLSGLERAFAPVGLRVYGPTQAQLLKCAGAIAESTSDSVRLATDGLAAADAKPAALYRRLVAPPGDASDRPGKGAALNDQSIVLSVAAGDSRALLTGDMQFAQPEIEGIEEEMGKLKAAVKAGGPYQFMKVAHHGSYNGLDADVMTELSEGVDQFAISGGADDPNHPFPAVLQLLKKAQAHWTRTDRNGLISVTLGAADAPQVAVSRGDKDDPTPNTGDAPAGEVAAAPPRPPAPVVQARQDGDGIVEVVARIPHVRTSVRVTIEVDPAGDEAAAAPRPVGVRVAAPDEGAAPPPAPKLAGGQRLPPLLFVTSREALTLNIGEKEAAQALQWISDAGQALFDKLPAGATAEETLPVVRRELAARPDVRGLVILGGYDILLPQVQDVLDATLRAAVQGKITDADNFIVWTDWPYGDVGGDGNRVVPVSRIPDGKSPVLVFAALAAVRPAGNPPPFERYGIRNDARPFAEGIFTPLPGVFRLLVSRPTLAARLQANDMTASNHHYFMLHGDDRNGTQFWGEDDGDYPVAYEVRNVPDKTSGVVFTGCCWGALAADPKASRYQPGQLAPRTPDNSIALSFLQAGALAFIGCTGSHYSPTAEPYNYYGGPMHQAFWRRYVVDKLAPAQALLETRMEYLAAIPHRPGDDLTRAIEMKIFRQYTCLGLGWSPDAVRPQALGVV